MRKVLLTLAAGLLALAASAFWAAPAMAADAGTIDTSRALAATPDGVHPLVACGYSTICSPDYGGVNMRRTPHLYGAQVAWIPDITNGHHTGVFIVCWAPGDDPGYAGGPWFSTSVWYYVNWTESFGWNSQGFINGGFINTGGVDPIPGLSQCT